MIIPAKLYVVIYYFIIIFLTIIYIFKYSRYKEQRVSQCHKNGSIIPSLILIIVITLFIGFRPISGTFVDMMNYLAGYEHIQNISFGFEYNDDTPNLIFDNIYYYFASNWIEITFFFLIIAIIYFGCIFWGLKKLFPNDLFYAILIYLGALSTFAYGTNGIKAGAAASIFILVFAYYRKPILAILFCLISLGFHHSMTLPILAFVLAYLIKNPKYFFLGWMACLFLSFFHFGFITDFLAQFADAKGQGYLLADDDSLEAFVGFRWDFILYSLPPVLIGIWTIYKHNGKDRLYQLLLCTYLTVNGVWMLCMYVPYNNRIAYLSWFILPIVSIYPFLKLKLDTRQYIQLNYVVSIYLAFTLLATFFIK